ncbi:MULTISPECIES: HEAT repeat domain-containing protein [unclassified Prochlorococcus]|uniref:HEAT repeat domain-containing protein n=1 Tax=unclassified Prochlorococcus TaxID=2627481 RepID=UPI000533743F|nr:MULTISPECIES: HEAT repeat domain-containing protein [unclassified Prochlorococcus]KGG16618.1 Bilin biosynthesis protein CpeY [Prochlorococcus sp. MIT 0602]KGG18410.1 Bilin biosynthesis protein CpeY [Prochlorococcus sp. MIT 0603]
MNLGAFDTLPKLSKNDALSILKTPLQDLNLSSDYYKAVFHLAKYPSPESEKALLDLVKSQSAEKPILLAKRKAIEILGRMGSKKAIPHIAKNLKSLDPYIVENSAWALQQIGCDNIEIHNLIGSLLEENNQNHRVLIQSLAKMGATSQLSKINAILSSEVIPIGVKGASIAAIKILTGKSQNVDLLRDHLSSANQNDRQCAVQDIIDAKEYDLIESIIQTPISPFFRLRAIDLLWPEISDDRGKSNALDLIDLVLLDNPKAIRPANKYQKQNEIKTLIKRLFSTDFCKAYSSLSSLLDMRFDYIFPALQDELKRFKKDYGAIYFLLILLRNAQISVEIQRKKSMELVDYCLDKSWPDFMKFKPQAILLSMEIDIEFFTQNLESWLNEKETPYWACRYAALICVEKLVKNNMLNIDIKHVIERVYDENKFVCLKAKKFQSKYI